MDFIWIYTPGMATDTEKRKHSQPVLVRFTEKQLEIIDKAAERAGLNRTAWVRTTLLTAARDQVGEGS